MNGRNCSLDTNACLLVAEIALLADNSHLAYEVCPTLGKTITAMVGRLEGMLSAH